MTKAAAVGFTEVQLTPTGKKPGSPGTPAEWSNNLKYLSPKATAPVQGDWWPRKNRFSGPPPRLALSIQELSPRPWHPDVSARCGLPMRGHPHSVNGRSSYPRSGYPLIAGAIPVVIALHPNVLRTRTYASHIGLNCWRRRRCRHGGYNPRSGNRRSGCHHGSRRRCDYNFSSPARHERNSQAGESDQTSNP